ncbi:MAG TPA: LuxR C-terminal-related transcriptional regulator [Candidatus Baltobacteraceae bacterium]|nr:LuxR C-terminal-related transcriptional regulator [Candidatus Baltobacteraceae bacterium]
MRLVPQSADVFIAPDPALEIAVARFLKANPDATVGHVAASLDGFTDLSIAGLIALAKELPGTPKAASRHLAPVPKSSADTRAMLSERELQVVRHVAEGISNKEISLRMELSDKTVKNHISHILAKLHLTARTQIAVHALRTGLA